MSGIESYLKKRTILVTGGTGSFGHEIVNELVRMKPKEVIIFSRDEDKHYHMRNEFSDIDFLRFEIGDVRDYSRIREVMHGVDVVFHAAALKHVPSCESFPMEAIKTNVMGAKNVIDACIEEKVEKMVGISTDKAVKPINIMGMSKAAQEKIVIAADQGKWNTRFTCVRYGNVLSSRGSVVPFFKDCIQKGKPLPITDPIMTRFSMVLNESIQLVFKAAVEGEGGELFVRKMPAYKIVDLAAVMGKVMGNNPDYPTKIVGIRPGEKLHETLVTEEEISRSVEQEEHFVVYPHWKKEMHQTFHGRLTEYASNNTHLLTEDEIVAQLKRGKVI